MKVCLAIIAGLSAISSATPTPREVDILLTVKVEDNAPITAKQSSRVSASNSILYPPGPCLMVCWPESPQCPAGWDATNMTPDEEDRPCWTCCRHPDDDALVAKPHKKAPKFVEAAPTKKNILATPPNICLKVCWPEESKCPDGWSSYKFGSDDYPCWTCCRNADDDALVAKLPKKTPKFVEASPSQKVFGPGNLCWKICWPEEPQCPDGWSPLNNGNNDYPCWTCCLNEPDDDFVPEL